MACPINGFHGISSAGVNMVKVCITLTDNGFPYQNLCCHHVRQLVGICIIL